MVQMHPAIWFLQPYSILGDVKYSSIAPALAFESFMVSERL